MYPYRFVRLLYCLLFLWAGGGTAIGVYCALTPPPMEMVAAAAGAMAILMFCVYVMRLGLVSFVMDLSPRDKLFILLAHGLFFFAPLLISRQAPRILLFVSLNIPLVCMCHLPHQWHRLVFNNNLIIFGALLFYPLPLWAKGSLLLATAVLWIFFLTTDHFLTVLDETNQSETGMFGLLFRVAFSRLGRLLIWGTPIVGLTLLLGTFWGGLSMAPGLTAPSSSATEAVYKNSEFREPIRIDFQVADIMALFKSVLLLIALTIAAALVFQYLRRRLHQVLPEPLAMEIDPGAEGQTVAPPERPTKRSPRSLTPNQAAIISRFDELCRAFKHFGRGRLSFQTAREYAAMLLPFAPRPHTTEALTRIFEKARYGTEAVTERDVEDFSERVRELRDAGARAYAAEMAKKHEADNTR